jgi:hypothetical protein
MWKMGTNYALKKTDYTCRAAMERLLPSALVCLETNYCSMV